MIGFFRWVVLTSALSGAVLTTSASTAWAQKGGSGGGTSSGGGGGGGGTSTNPTKGVNSYSFALSGTPLLPAANGTATVSFNSLLTYRAFTIQLNDLDLPDGSILYVTFYDDSKVFQNGYYTALYNPQYGGCMMVMDRSASLIVPNGTLNTPQFGKNGFVYVTTFDAYGNVYLLATGSYAALGGP
jgi:hypothetical protein